MGVEIISFKSGDRVRVKKEPSTGLTGKVVNTLTAETRRGLHEIVWVQLTGGKVDGFSPSNLEKLEAV